MTTPAATAHAEARPRRRLLGWLAIVIAVVLVALAALTLAGSGWAPRDALDPESTGPTGTRALARVLAEQGVEVRVARDRAAALSALDEEATLVLPDAPGLSDQSFQQLADAADDVVLLEPRARTLRLLLPGSRPAGSAGTDELAPECAFPAAQRAGAVVGGSLTSPGETAVGCYPEGDAFALVTAEAEGRTVRALDGRAMLTNEVLDRAGNASLALSVVGSRPTVVWYVPSVGDTDIGAAAPTLGELTPEWVTPVLVLLAITAGAAAFWRGRRFGPLVVENLPVTVRASETTAGRARLYAHSRDRAHALDQLRLGALERISRALGLAAHADESAVADAAAARLNADRVGVRSILIDRIPRSDRELVELAEQLRDIEARVRAAARPERNSP